jgi:hypothetical protein
LIKGVVRSERLILLHEERMTEDGVLKEEMDKGFPDYLRVVELQRRFITDLSLRKTA